jgi:hypothetical protein
VTLNLRVKAATKLLALEFPQRAFDGRGGVLAGWPQTHASILAWSVKPPFAP